MNANPRLHSFIGGSTGTWLVTSSRTITGGALPSVARLDYSAGRPEWSPGSGGWILSGVTSNDRYVTRPEKQQLLARQPALGRPDSDRAVLIPIRKSPAWWAMTQDERRRIFEERSRHNSIGMDYLPAIARRLHHCRDLEDEQPFDFLTWFEFEDRYAGAFDELLDRLRATEEWSYVEREVELRLSR